MTTVLAQGVNLHVIPTKKYKTIRLLVRFSTQLDQTTITKRALLSSLLETNSLNYPTQTQISEKLADLYGASFGVNVSKKGNLHLLNLSMSLVNDRYLQDTQVLADAVAFLREILFYPNIKEGAFDAETFAREKENLATYYESVVEDKQVLAGLAVQQLYFQKSAAQRIPSFGRAEDLQAETAASIAAYYQEMLANDQIDILVLGDVEEAEVATLIAQLPFADRIAAHGELFYTQPQRNVIEERVEKDELAQSKLNLAYHADIYYGDQQYFALQVFNGLFGGYPHSKLFMNVREKENLAYYASSSVDVFRGVLTVQTGIDGKNRNQVLHLIAAELDQLRSGVISENELAQTKAMLKNHYLLGLDNMQALLENAYIEDLLPHLAMSEEAWLQGVDAVTIADVQQVAKLIQLQAVFFLEGDAAHE